VPNGRILGRQVPMFICLREMEDAEERLLRHHRACEARERDMRRILNCLSTDHGAPVVLIDKSGAGLLKR
jgi:hypothetical protein